MPTYTTARNRQGEGNGPVLFGHRGLRSTGGLNSIFISVYIVIGTVQRAKSADFFGLILQYADIYFADARSVFS